jgi:hypothetical protein
MSSKKNTYVPGPRMGTNNFLKGLEIKGSKSNGSKKRSKTRKGGSKRV